MKTFSMDANDRLLLDNSGTRANNAGRHFASEQQWSKIASDLPMPRLVGIWNALPGATPVQRFTSRAKAIHRIWAALQEVQQKQDKLAAKAGETRRLKPQSDNPDQNPGEKTESRKAQLIALLRQQNGVALEQLISATGWQKHSIRGFLSGTVRRKMGLKVISSRNAEGKRVYRIEA